VFLCLCACMHECKCLHVCICSVYNYMCMCVRACFCFCVCISVCVCACVCSACMHVGLQVGSCRYIYMYVCLPVFVCMYVYVCMQFNHVCVHFCSSLLIIIIVTIYNWGHNTAMPLQGCLTVNQQRNMPC